MWTYLDPILKGHLSPAAAQILAAIETPDEWSSAPPRSAYAEPTPLAHVSGVLTIRQGKTPMGKLTLVIECAHMGAAFIQGWQRKLLYRAARNLVSLHVASAIVAGTFGEKKT